MPLMRFWASRGARATAGRRNSKSETRNAKQIQITKQENPKLEGAVVLDFGDSARPT
jgi:hypothetical protein